jgi:hypothetical protein
MTGEVSATPDAPEYITMTVSWTADPGATSYIVKYTESENPNAAPVTASDTHAQINVIPEELVCIQVQAVNSYGKSAFYPSSPYCTTG